MTDIRPRILATDDVPANLMTLGVALAPDFDLQTITSGAAGIALARESPPDLILLDLVVPEIDGYETCRRLKADPLSRDIPMLFLSAKDSAIDEARALEIGATDFVTKPANPIVLRARINFQLTLRRQTEALRSLADTDALTGLANRRQFDETLQREWCACLRCGSPLSLITLDVDQFKPFNDCCGHPEANRCLQTLAGVLGAALARPRDLVARIGGEICMPAAGHRSRWRRLRGRMLAPGGRGAGDSARSLGGCAGAHAQPGGRDANSQRRNQCGSTAGAGRRRAVPGQGGLPKPCSPARIGTACRSALMAARNFSRGH